MSERIIIEFDDGKDNKKKEDERIVIDFDKAEDKIVIEEIEESYERKILKAKINSCYRGNTGISNYYESNLKFPEGIEKGFRLKKSLQLEDEFYNSILENNRFIVLSSKKGNAYLIDRFSGKINQKIFFENESFEKTGLVYENFIYLNSLRKVHELNKTGISKREIFSSGDAHFIWSNLNRFGDLIAFTRYNPEMQSAVFTVINPKDSNDIREFNFEVTRFVGDSVCMAGECAYVMFDEKILEYNFMKNTGKIYNAGTGLNENSLMFFLNSRLWITSDLNELYYAHIPEYELKFKYSGIKNVYLNSAGGFDDNLFIGTLEGWKFYKTGGLQVYSYEDENENKIECISKNILVVSRKNKIMFCNLNRFQEAEGYVISTDKPDDAIEIVSAVIIGNEIAVLTSGGLLELFTNDKLNIHI